MRRVIKALLLLSVLSGCHFKGSLHIQEDLNSQYDDNGNVTHQEKKSKIDGELHMSTKDSEE